ncbi:MAG: hypothetical protein M1829_000673 [Trizodia sp. TS-e1964]|nr:MAG: hypothetical protein M1829_000673 [Trizodia sp. TS-e1964]
MAYLGLRTYHLLSNRQDEYLVQQSDLPLGLLTTSFSIQGGIPSHATRSGISSHANTYWTTNGGLLCFATARRPTAVSSAPKQPATRVDSPAGPVASSSARRIGPPSAPLRRTLAPESAARGTAIPTSSSRRTSIPASIRSGVNSQPPRLTFSLEKPAAPVTRRARAAPAGAGAAQVSVAPGLTVPTARRASRSSPTVSRAASSAASRPVGRPVAHRPVAGPPVVSRAPIPPIVSPSPPVLPPALPAAIAPIAQPEVPLAAASPVASAPEAAVAVDAVVSPAPEAAIVASPTTVAPPTEIVAEEPAPASIARAAPAPAALALPESEIPSFAAVAPPTIAAASAAPGDDIPSPGPPSPDAPFPAPPTAPAVSSGARRSCLAGRGSKKTTHARFAGPAEDEDDAPFRASQERRWYSPKDRSRRFLTSAEVLPEYLVFTGKWAVSDQLPLSARADIRFAWDAGWATLQQDNNALRSEGRLPDYYDLPNEQGYMVGEARLLALDLVGHLEELEEEEAGDLERQREQRMAAFLKLDEERARKKRRDAAAARYKASKAGKPARRMA